MSRQIWLINIKIRLNLWNVFFVECYISMLEYFH